MSASFDRSRLRTGAGTDRNSRPMWTELSHAAPVTQPSRLASALPRRRWKGGGPCRIRTCGLRIRSPTLYPTELRARRLTVAEREGFEPSIQLWAVYWFSKPAPSASRPPLPASVQPLPRATCPRKRSVLDRALPGVKDGLEWDRNVGTSATAVDPLVFWVVRVGADERRDPDAA